MNDLNDPLSEGLYTVGKVTVDKSFHTQSADEEFFRFFGNDVIYSIKRTVHEKDFPRLEGCVASAVCEESLRTVVRMNGVDTDFRWMLSTVKMLSDTSAEPLYSITLSDIFSLEALAYSRERRIAEYRHVFSMTSDLAFEYNFETKLIRIYMFDCFREITITRVSLSQWRKNALDSGYISSRYIDTFKPNACAAASKAACTASTANLKQAC